jgi:hypothetical protein
MGKLAVGKLFLRHELKLTLAVEGFTGSVFNKTVVITLFPGCMSQVKL